MTIYSRDPRFSKLVPLGPYESVVGKSHGETPADKAGSDVASPFSLAWGDIPAAGGAPHVGRQWRTALTDLRPLERQALDVDDLRVAGRTAEYRVARDAFLDTVAGEMPKHFAATEKAVAARGLQGQAARDAVFAIMDVLVRQQWK